MKTEADLARFRTVSLMDAARTLGISRTHAYRLVGAGRFPLPVRRVNSSWRVRLCDLEDYWSDPASS